MGSLSPSDKGGLDRAQLAVVTGNKQTINLFLMGTSTRQVFLMKRAKYMHCSAQCLAQNKRVMNVSTCIKKKVENQQLPGVERRLKDECHRQAG